MSIRMLGNRIGVEKLGKSKDKSSFLAIPEDSDAMGLILYVGDSQEEELLRFKVGMKIIYGKDRHQVKMNGVDVWVMPPDNVYAIVEEDRDAKKEDTVDSETA